MLFRGRRLEVEATKTHATYRLLDGQPLEIAHHGKVITISADRPAVEAIPTAPHRPAPVQPAGRAPLRRGKAQPA
jgi:alpha,alpha-trehalose phosphorylase